MLNATRRGRPIAAMGEQNLDTTLLERGTLMRNGDYYQRVYCCGVVGIGAPGVVGFVEFGTGTPGGAVGVPGGPT